MTQHLPCHWSVCFGVVCERERERERTPAMNVNSHLWSMVVFVHYNNTIDIINKDCRRSCSAILTWVLENVKISVRPFNSIGNGRIFTLLLKCYLLPLAHILLRVKCRYMSLVCINVTNIFFCRVVFFSSCFFQPDGKPV